MAIFSAEVNLQPPAPSVVEHSNFPVRQTRLSVLNARIRAGLIYRLRPKRGKAARRSRQLGGSP